MDYLIQSSGQLASHLRALRKSRGVSQAGLGAMLGVGQTRVARIEGDPSAVSVEQFLALLNALGVQMVLRASAAEQRPGRGAKRAASTRRRAAATSGEEPW